MRWAAIIGGALGLFVVGALVLVLFAPIPAAPPSGEQPAQSEPTWAAAGPAPVAAADPGAGIQSWADADWAAQMAAAINVIANAPR